ncbi:MAG: hypothetical protein CMN57_12525 [Gammaproteobacteria bacterium]|nr:hypothetical protein [Gammaproteobacteria bacterium]
MQTDTHVFLIGILCALIFLGFSWVLNRRLMRGPFRIDALEIALYAATVFLVAVTCEILVNSGYEALFGRKLWEYRILPLYDGDISLLAFIIWPVYGVHLYFFRQVLAKRLPKQFNRDRIYAAVIGLDAPLFYEVCGNLLFLLLLGEYYAYYLPGELFHLTSVQVIPIYMVFIYLGMKVLDWFMRVRFYRWPWLVYLMGLVVVSSAYAW